MKESVAFLCHERDALATQSVTTLSRIVRN